MSETWQQRYADRIQRAERAVLAVRPEHRVFVGSGAGEPQDLVDALSAREDLSDTEIVHLLTLGVATYAEPRFGSRFRHNAYFIGPNVREAIREGRADYRIMLKVFHKCGFPVESSLEDGVYSLTIPFRERVS